MFEHVHGLSHDGQQATRWLGAACFVWHGLATDVLTWCKECAACNRAKLTRQPTMTVEKMAIPSARFSHVHLDIVGQLPPVMCRPHTPPHNDRQIYKVARSSPAMGDHC